MGLRTLSDHIVDIAQNAVESGTKLAWLNIEELEGTFFSFEVKDAGRGIPEQLQATVLDPFYTEKRKKTKFGLGLPMLKFAALATGGDFKLQSAPGAGTVVFARFATSNLDCQPVGDIPTALFTIVTMSEEVDWHIQRKLNEDGYAFTSGQFREVLGNNCFTVPVKMKVVLEILQEAEKSLGG